MMVASRVQIQQKYHRDILPKPAVRVLHIVETLNDQAVENWLLRVLRTAVRDYPHIHWTFFCVVGKRGRLDDEARALGAEVIHSPYEIGDKRRFFRSLREVMKRGRYDILHCHHDIMSAVYLAASAGLPFRKRIVHLHNTSLSLPTPSKIKTGLAREPMKQVCLRMADQIVGISKEALESLIGNRAPEPGRHAVVHYAVDTARFAQDSVDRAEFRRSLGFDPTTKILLFVGRLVDYKNPQFVLDILEHLARTNAEVAAVFAGTGNRETELRERAKQRSLENRVRLLGFRDDVPELMLNSDVLLWPSVENPKEGLGLGIVEAQAAGLPILMSRSAPDEAIVVPDLVNVLTLSAGAGNWAKKAAEILNGTPISREQSLAMVESSSFSMNAGVRNLVALYD